jgi:hypothetical protein
MSSGVSIEVISKGRPSHWNRRRRRGEAVASTTRVEAEGLMAVMIPPPAVGIRIMGGVRRRCPTVDR